MNSMYKVCPQCEKKTDPINNVSSIDKEEALSMRLTAMFARWEKLPEDYDPDAVQAEIDERFTLKAWKHEAREWEARRFAAVSPTSGVSKPRKGIHGASS